MKPNTLTKTIAWAYAGSTYAKYFGMEETGCFYIECTRWNIEGSGQCNTCIHPQNTDGFLEVLDLDLQAMFIECGGEVHKEFAARHPNWYAAGTIEACKPAPQLSTECLAYFMELAEDAGNWNGSPLIGGNVRQTKQAGGYLTDLKMKELLFTQEEEGNVWAFFTDAGRALALQHGTEIPLI